MLLCVPGSVFNHVVAVILGDLGVLGDLGAFWGLGVLGGLRFGVLVFQLEAMCGVAWLMGCDEVVAWTRVGEGLGVG